MIWPVKYEVTLIVNFTVEYNYPLRTTQFHTFSWSFLQRSYSTSHLIIHCPLPLLLYKVCIFLTVKLKDQSFTHIHLTHNYSSRIATAYNYILSIIKHLQHFVTYTYTMNSLHIWGRCLTTLHRWESKEVVVYRMSASRSETSIDPCYNSFGA